MRKITITMLMVLIAVASWSHDAEIDGIFYNFGNGEACVTYKGSHHYGNDYPVTVTIPSTVTFGGVEYPVTGIGERAFAWCKETTEVKIPSSVTWIGKGAFEYCDNLLTVTIPSTITDIGEGAFRSCFRMKSVHITDLVAWMKIKFEYGDYTNPLFSARHLFLNGTEITDLIIPEGTTRIGDFTFCGCTGIRTVTIPNSVTSIGTAAFYGCTGITQAEIPDGVTVIEDRAFEYCPSLTSLAIPDAVGSIGAYAFRDCDGLTTATIGKSVKEIGTQAFSRCKGIKTMTCLAEELPTADADLFRDSYFSTSTLFVPTSLVETCRNTAPWSDFGTVKSIPGGTTSIAQNSSASSGHISQSGGIIRIDGLSTGDSLTAYCTDGSIAASATAAGNTVQLDLSALRGKTAILYMSGKTIKILIQ